MVWYSNGMEQKTWKKSVTVAEAMANAARGVADATRREWKLKIAAVCAAGALGLSWVLSLSATAISLIIFISAVVIATEMVNSALETILDSMFPEYHQGVRQAKDLAAGAVLVLSLAAAVIAVLLLLPPAFQWFFG